jgi:hypothetical protein
MDLNVKDEIYQIIQEFTKEPAYQRPHLLSQESHDLFMRMQSELVNAHHILGEIEFVGDGIKDSPGSVVALGNLETFVMHASAAKDLRLIMPAHLENYQNRVLKIIKSLDSRYKTVN